MSREEEDNPAPKTFQDLFGKTYVGPDDLKGKPDVRTEFASYKVATVFNPNTNAKEVKLTLTVKGGKKAVVLNKTSARALAAVWGKPTGTDWSDWLNRPIIIRYGMVNRKPAVLITPAAVAPGKAAPREEPGATEPDDLGDPPAEVR